MTIKFLASMLHPDVLIGIFRDGKLLDAVRASEADVSKFGECEVADWTMGQFVPTVDVEIK